MKKPTSQSPEQVHAFDLKTRFLLEAISEAQTTNRFLDTKAGVVVSIESTLLFVVVATIFDIQKYQTIRDTIFSMSPFSAVLILVYCAIYVMILVAHIIYTIRVLNPSKNPGRFVQLAGYQPKGLFFLARDKATGKIRPTLEQYVDQLGGCSEQDILSELTFEFMKLSYIRDAKAENILNSMAILRYMIVGIMVFGLILVLSY